LFGREAKEITIVDKFCLLTPVIRPASWGGFLDKLRAKKIERNPEKAYVF
jgi:hypothetical protein